MKAIDIFLKAAHTTGYFIKDFEEIVFSSELIILPFIKFRHAHVLVFVLNEFNVLQYYLVI
jgi:hypothetical protein